MQIFLSSIILLLISNTCLSQENNPYIREGSIGKRVTPVNETAREIDSFRPVGEWVGERFVFLPKIKSSQVYGYQGFDGNHAYQKYVGRIAKVISVGEGRSFPKVFFKMEDTGEELSATSRTQSISDIAPVADIDSARAHWLGATLWYKGKQIVFYDEKTDKFGGIDIKKYSPVKVNDIVAGWHDHSPVRFIIQNTTGDEGFVDINISGTNVAEILRKYNKFEDNFFTENPRVTFKWSDKVWTAIEEGRVFVGMTSQQAELSWGKPEEINRTTVGSKRSEQWVYTSGSYLYFDHGALTGIQN